MSIDLFQHRINAFIRAGWDLIQEAEYECTFQMFRQKVILTHLAVESTELSRLIGENSALFMKQTMYHNSIFSSYLVLVTNSDMEYAISFKDLEKGKVVIHDISRFHSLDEERRLKSIFTNFVVSHPRFRLKFLMNDKGCVL